MIKDGTLAALLALFAGLILLAFWVGITAYDIDYTRKRVKLLEITVVEQQEALNSLRRE